MKAAPGDIVFGGLLVALEWIWDTIVTIFNSHAFTNILLIILIIMVFFVLGIAATR
jgi:small basic protein